MRPHEVINTRNWDLLLDAVDNERVVPIVGSEFFYIEDPDTNERVSIENFVISSLSKQFHIEENPIDLTMISDTIDEQNYRNRRNYDIGNQTDIYFEIDKILRTSKVKCQREIVNFLSIHKFPLILSTSYIPGLEIELKAQYGDIDIKVYDKSIRSDINLQMTTVRPTLFYLFGKSSRIKKSFMVTEDDLLDYLHLWHNSETRPFKISDYLKDKFLMVLGCSYPNWLFRFFWHSIRNFTLSPNSYDMQGVVTLKNINEDYELTRFLSRIQTQIYENSRDFLEEFIKRWESREKNSDPLFDDNHSEDVDIFISYAKEDVDVVKNIAERLRSAGANVWLDENKLEMSDMYEGIIEKKIAKAKRFIPIISHTTITSGRRFFRREWSIAIREMDYRLGMPYFAPIVIDDSDMNHELIPEPFKKSHIINIKDENFDIQIKKLIRSFRA